MPRKPSKTLTPTVETSPMSDTTTALAPLASLAIQKVNPERVMAAFAESGMGAFSPWDLQQIRVPGSGSVTWPYPDRVSKKPFSEFLDVVIIYQHAGRQYYDQPYDQTAVTHAPPACASFDGVTGYGSPGGACERCPLSQFGEACNPMRFAYCLYPEANMPALLQIPRTSLQNFRKYLAALGFSGQPLSGVVTRLGLTGRKNGPGSVITFEMLNTLTDDAWTFVRKYAEVLRHSISYQRVSPTSKPVDPTAKVETPPQTPQRDEVQGGHRCNVYCTATQHFDHNADPIDLPRSGAVASEGKTAQQHADDLFDDIGDPTVPSGTVNR